MHSSGMLACIANHILKVAKGTGGLITATGITAVFVNLVCGEQYLSILLTGRMYKDEYEKEIWHRRICPERWKISER